MQGFTLDLPSIFLAAQQAKANEQTMRMNEMRMAEMERQQRMAAQLPYARRDFLAGNAEPLEAMAPEEAMKRRMAAEEEKKFQAQAQAGIAEAQKSAQEAAAARQTRTAHAVVNSIDAVLANPAAYGQVRQELGRLGGQGIINQLDLPEQAPDRDSLLQMRASLAAQIKREPTPEMQNALYAAGDDDAKARRIVESRMQPDGKAPAEIETAYRKEFDSLPEVKAAKEVLTAYNKVQNSSDTPAGQMGLVFGYMKMLDPGSSVREGEYANASNTTGAAGKLYNTYNSILNGNILNPTQAAQFKSEARMVLEQQMRGYNAKASEYRRMAEALGINPANVILPIGYDGSGRKEQPRPAAQPPPPIGGINAAAGAQGWDAPMPARQTTKQVAPAAPINSVAAGPDMAAIDAQMQDQQPPVPAQTPQRSDGAQPQKEAMPQKVRRITDEGFAAGKTPAQIADDLVAAGMPRGQRAKAIENLNRQFIKRKRKQGAQRDLDELKNAAGAAADSVLR